MDRKRVGTNRLERAAMTSYKTGYADALADAKRIVESEDELPGTPPQEAIAALIADPIGISRAVVRATKKSIIKRLAVLEK